MRACTSVVTEIAYHPDKVIKAEIVFLSEDEWRAELSTLLQDVTANGNCQLPNNDKDARSAWEKVRIGLIWDMQMVDSVYYR
jgi:hypothetical protein